jgi:hypothetical protein
MATQVEPFAVVFPDWYDDRAEFETPLKGFLNDVVVRLDDGACYQLFFTDPVRLQQSLQDEVNGGRGYYTEPGLVVLPEVTTESIRKAVAGLWRDGFFARLKPVS